MADIFVNVKDFGAKGDGDKNSKNNDTVAIQNAIKSAAAIPNSVVYIPAGVYCVRNLMLTKGVCLMGTGRGSVLKSHKSCVVWDNTLMVSGQSNVNIDGIAFDGNKGVVAGNKDRGVANLRIESCTNINVRDCFFQNNGYVSIYIVKSNILFIENNQFLNSDCGVLTMDAPSSNLIIRGNYFDGAADSECVGIFGSVAGYHTNVVIANNIMKNHINGHAIGLKAVKHVTVTGNVIDSCNDGVRCEEAVYGSMHYGVYNAVITGNCISNSVYEGMLISNTFESVISGNAIMLSGTVGLMLTNVSNSIVTSNLVQDTGSGGIVSSNVLRSLVSNNLVQK